MPYQLHCAPAEVHVLTELDEATLLEERSDDEATSDEDDERNDEATTEDTTLDLAEDAVPPQIAPVTTGVSTAPLVLTCTPKEMDCPGCTVPFQPRLDAL